MDTQTRHGRKSASRRFDGHKLDIMVDERSELVLGVEVRAGNASDGEGAVPLLAKVTAVEGIEVATLLGTWPIPTGTCGRPSRRPVPTWWPKVPPVTNAGRFSQDRLRHRPERRAGYLPGQPDHLGRPAV